MGAQLADAIPDIENTGCTGAKSSSIEEIDDQVSRQFCQHQKDDEHLESCCEFADQLWSDLNFSESVMKENQAQYEQYIPAENKSRQPYGNAGKVRIVVQTQHNKPGDKQQFVGEGIQDGAQFADLIVFPRDESINGITQRCQAKQSKSRISHPFISPVNVVEHGHDKDRHDQDSEDGDLVGNGHFNLGAIPGGVPLKYGNVGVARFPHHLCHC